MTTTFRPNPRAADELADQPSVRAHLEATATEAGQATRRIAATFARTRAFERSIEVAGARVLTTDRAGPLIEFGSANNPPYAPLRRAAIEVGARVVDTGRG